MGNIVTEVTQKIRDRVPDSAGRWEDSHIRSMLHLADLAIKEEAESYWGTETISLQSGSLYYGLPESIIAVRAVEFSTDGSDYDYRLKPITYDKLDRVDGNWMNATATIPEHYLLISAPGVEGYSRIMIWRPIASVTNETIRLQCLKCFPENNLSFVAATAPGEIQDRLYVPYTLALLYGTIDPRRASSYMEEYGQNVSDVASRYGSRYEEGIGTKEEAV